MRIDNHYYSDFEIRKMLNVIKKTEEEIKNRIYEIDLQETENMTKCQGCQKLFVEPRSKIKNGLIESVYQMPICCFGHHECCGRKVVKVLHEEITEFVNVNV